MRKFLTGMMVMLFIIAVILAAVFGYLFFTRANEINQAKQDKLNAELEVTALQNTVEQLSAPRKFIDDEFDVNIDYPFDWQGVLSTKIASFAIDDIVGEGGGIIAKYNYTLTKGNAELVFSKILGGVGGLIQALDPAEIDFVVVPSTKGDLVRYSEKGKNEWRYVSKADCADAANELPTPDATCVDPFFPGFGKALYASSAKLTGASEPGILEEADQIALSAQR
jgi:hypothetical protein